MNKKNKNHEIETLSAHLGKKPIENHGIPSPPVYRTSTILNQTMESYRNRDMKYTYGRNGTPTSDSLICSIASIYNADGCVACFIWDERYKHSTHVCFNGW